MRQLVAIFTLISLLVSSFVVFTQPVSAADRICFGLVIQFRNDTASPDSAEIFFRDYPTVTVTYSATATLQPGETRTVSLYGFVPGYPVEYGYIPHTLTFLGYLFVGTADDSFCLTAGAINDGRINAYDLGAPLAAYCSNGGIAVWDIDDQGQGTLAFTATADQISAALSTAASSGQNPLVAEGMGDSLYALMSNQIALFGPDVKESGKTYQFIAPADVCN